MFTIAADFPQHWDIARQHGFWDVTRGRRVERGDTLLFWQSGGQGLRALAVASRDTEEFAPESRRLPWSPNDKRLQSYRYRIYFDLLSESPQERWNWADVQQKVLDSGALPSNGTFIIRAPGADNALRQAFGLNSAMLEVARQVVQEIGPDLGIRSIDDSSKPYIQIDISRRSNVPVIFEVDPEIIDRGNVGHATTQNLVANWLTEHGITPLDSSGIPKFDVAWRTHGVTYVGEVKSLQPANERHQIRVGIGQVLEYAYQLDAQPVLIVEQRPTLADYWTAVCGSCGVQLVWPETLDALVDG